MEQPWTTDNLEAHTRDTLREQARASEDLTYYGELTDPGIAVDCRDRRDCDFHYVVRSGGLWVQAFHNEKDARAYVGCLHVGGCRRHRRDGAA